MSAVEGNQAGLQNAWPTSTASFIAPDVVRLCTTANGKVHISPLTLFEGGAGRG
jgi:hypothetical protein